MLGWAAPGALADTTIGEQNLVPNMGSVDQLGQNIPVFQGDAGAGYVLSAPQAGTITSWRFLSGGVATGKHYELAVLAPVDQSGMGWRLIATSPSVAVTTATGSDAVNGPFAVQIAIDAGERIALVPVDDSSTPIEAGTQGADGIRSFSQPFNGGLGSSQQVASTADNGQVVPIQATIGSGASPPVNATPPMISGTARQFETLTADEGLWQNGVTTFTDTWLRCAPDGTSCAVIPGATSTTYTLTSQDVGFTIRFQVTASNGDGDSPPVQSAPTAVVQRGVITAKLTLSPSPSCTDIPTTFNASGSVSPDGIKSYTFTIVDLWAAANQGYGALSYGQGEASAERTIDDFYAKTLLTEPDSQSAKNIITYASETTVVTNGVISRTFDFNRADLDNPSILVRDPVGVVVDVTDYAGHTAGAVGVLFFAQRLSSASRTSCPKLIIAGVPSTVVRPLTFRYGRKLSAIATASCQTLVRCVGSITVVAGGAGRSCDSCASPAAKLPSRALASAFFNIPPHRKQKITLALTKLGKRVLRRGARVPVRVTVVSVGPTGRSRTRVYSEVLTP